MRDGWDLRLDDRDDAVLEILEIGGRRRLPPLPRVLAIGLAAVLVGAVVARGVVMHGHSQPLAAASAVVPTSAAPASPVLPEDESPPGTGLSLVLALVSADAYVDLVVPTQTMCPFIDDYRRAPQLALARAVDRVLPGFAFSEFAATYDRFGRVCQLDGRGRDSHGTVLVVSVLASRTGAQVQRPLSHAYGSLVVQAVTGPTSFGWTVLVGSVGERAYRPTLETLNELAADRSVLW